MSDSHENGAEVVKKLEDACMQEYNELAGNIVLVTKIECYDDRGENVTLQLSTPAIARIDAYQDERNKKDSIIHWVYDFIDPMYDITILEEHPEIPDGVRPSWIYGTSRSTTGQIEPISAEIAPEELQIKYKDVEDSPYWREESKPGL